MNQMSGLCSLKNGGSNAVLSSLLVELIYAKGGHCMLDDLPALYQDYFGVPLNYGGASSLLDLIKELTFFKVFRVSIVID